MDRNVSKSSKTKRINFSSVPIKVSSYENLTNVTSSSNSIRRRKTDFDVQSMTWTTTSAKDFVTSYLRLKVKHQRIKHLRTSSIMGDTMLSASITISGKSSLSVFSEDVQQQRSSKNVQYHYQFYQYSYLLLYLYLSVAFRYIALAFPDDKIHGAIEYHSQEIHTQ